MRRTLIAVAALALVALAAPAAASANHHGSAKAGDRNRDGIPDRWERKHHLSLKRNEARRDEDHDGLNNKQEFEHGTDPRKSDTDDNGVEDRNEVHPVGTVVSFSNGLLTIRLANGQTVSGAVTPRTRIQCENENEVEHRNGDDFAVRDGGGDRSGSGSDDGGGDHDNSGPGDGGTQTTRAPAPSNSGPVDATMPGQPNQSGDDNNDNQNEQCGTAALAVDAQVRGAEADLTANGLVFEEIEV